MKYFVFYIYITMSLLSERERIDLKRLLNENDCEDNTEQIRRVKHSGKIQSDIHQFGFLKNLFFGSLPSEFTKISIEDSKRKQMDFEKMVQANCNFLYTTYPDIFRRMLKDELDLSIMVRLIEVLKMIEDNKTDQHEASVLFGKILKEMYIDSAIKHGDNLDLEHSVESKPVESGKNISWSEYKKSLM
jgi:hypothetical protein